MESKLGKDLMKEEVDEAKLCLFMSLIRIQRGIAFSFGVLKKISEVDSIKERLQLYRSFSKIGLGFTMVQNFIVGK